jgi:hypothetical protein
LLIPLFQWRVHSPICRAGWNETQKTEQKIQSDNLNIKSTDFDVFKIPTQRFIASDRAISTGIYLSVLAHVLQFAKTKFLWLRAGPATLVCQA